MLFGNHKGSLQRQQPGVRGLRYGHTGSFCCPTVLKIMLVVGANFIHQRCRYDHAPCNFVQVTYLVI